MCILPPEAIPFGADRAINVGPLPKRFIFHKELNQRSLPKKYPCTHSPYLHA